MPTSVPVAGTDISASVGSMGESDLRSFISECFREAKAIEDRYPSSVLPPEDETNRAKELLRWVDSGETRLQAFEERKARAQVLRSGAQQYGASTTIQHAQTDDDRDAAAQRQKSAGQLFIEAAEYRDLKGRGIFNSNRNPVQFAVSMESKAFIRELMERKTLVTSGTGSGGPLIVNDRLPGILELFQRERTILDLVPKGQTESDTIEYVKVGTFTNNAAVVAEATVTTGSTGRKPESALTTELVTAPVPTIAHWVPVTNKMLSDAPAIRGLIDQHLLVGLELELEDEVLTGDGTGEHMTGILNSGIQVQALGTDNAADAIYKGIVMVRVNGLVRPNAIVIHPNDLQDIRLARENAATGTLGGYLMGGPAIAGPMTLWGLPVYESTALTEGTALVGAFNVGGMLFERESSQIRVGTIDDQFVRNLQTILAEVRAVWATFRPSAFTQITGI